LGRPVTVPSRLLASSGHVWFADRRFGNVADHVGDDDARVAANRQRLAAELARNAPWVPDDPRRWVWLRQVHGAEVVLAGDASASGAEADAAVTATPGLPLAVVSADCVPVALATRTAVAAVHAGWRGLAAGVLERAVTAVRGGGDGGDVVAAVGPCIGPCHYAFGAEARDDLARRFGGSVAARTVDGEPAVDLRALTSVVLARAGVTDVDLSLCSCTFELDRWFSHRRDGVAGRQATIVVRAP
jgi:YfiH family protein